MVRVSAKYLNYLVYKSACPFSAHTRKLRSPAAAESMTAGGLNRRSDGVSAQEVRFLQLFELNSAFAAWRTLVIQLRSWRTGGMAGRNPYASIGGVRMNYEDLVFMVGIVDGRYDNDSPAGESPSGEGAYDCAL